MESVSIGEENGILAICVRGGIRQAIGVVDLPLPEPLPAGAEWIDAYRNGWAESHGNDRSALPPTVQAWVEVRTRHHLSHAQVQRGHELGLNPRKTRQDRQPPPGTMESAFASVHRAAVSQAVWPGATPGCDACGEVGAAWHWAEGDAERCRDERPRRALK